LNLYFKIVLLILGIAYLISPVDIVPDFLLPFVGFIDDGLMIGLIYYLIRYGTLPSFFSKQQRPFQKPSEKKFSHSDTKNQNSRSKEKESEQCTPKTPYEILGVRPDASKKEIIAAYKEAVKKYHPDKVSHLGDEFSSLAKEKFIEIRKAYDTLIK
jgi:uncharacterized membrane protein YkvA (DUF1232 family)